MLTTNVGCSILVSAKTASARISKVGERFHADANDSVEYRCLRCGLVWDDCPLREYREVTCSNCYSGRVVITTIRLGFENWGDNNGGKAEQKARWENARKRREEA